MLKVVTKTAEMLAQFDEQEKARLVSATLAMDSGEDEVAEAIATIARELGAKPSWARYSMGRIIFVETLEQAGKTEDAIKTKWSRVCRDSAITIPDSDDPQAKKKAEQLITTSTTVNQTPDLKQKEKAAKESMTTENMTSPAAKTEKTGEKGTTASGKKGVLARLKDKFFGKKESAEGKTTTEGTSPVSTPAALKEKTSPPPGIPSADSTAVKTPEALNPKVGAKSSTDGDSPKKSFKDAAKEEFGKTQLGSTINSISSLFKKKKEASVAESGMKNETTTLKDQSKAKSEPAKPQAEVKKEAEARKETSPAIVQSSESKKEENKSSAPTSAVSSSSDKGKQTQISAQDIQDIKGLLAAINTTLNGPLAIKNNKPFRPTSSMLE
jgi:hypothetical protein